MGKCAACGRSTDRTATVYIQASENVCSCRPQKDYFCGSCVKSSIFRSGKTTVIFYLALQMGWLSAAKNGFSSLWGIFGALIAAAGLLRLLTILAKLLLAALYAERPIPPKLARYFHFDDDASELYQSILCDMPEYGDKKILTLREYRRINPN